MAKLLTYSVALHTKDGTISNISRLDQEILDSAAVTNFTGVEVAGDELHINGDSVADEAGLDTVLTNHWDVSLDEYKSAKILQIDMKTGQLIGAGFSFDGETFSLSANAQINWVGLKSLENLLTWPVDITTFSDGEYSLTQANLDTFIGIGQVVVQSHLNSGRALKVSVNSATDKAGVDAVIDNR